MAILIAFLAVCFITQVINFKYGGAAVIGRLAYFALCILVLYSQYKSSVDSYKKTLIYSTRAISCAITPAIVASLIMFFTLFTGRLPLRAGVSAYVGVAENRLFGVFTSPNVGGMYALILIWCAIVNLHYLKKSKLKPLWVGISIFQILISLTFISLALSRGTHLAGTALLITFLAVRVPLGFEKKLNIWLQGAIRAVSVFLCLVIVIGALSVLRSSCIKITSAVVEAKQSAEVKEPKPEQNAPQDEQPDEAPEQNLQQEAEK
jgi:hypothetical protein